MSRQSALNIEPFRKKHNWADFSCDLDVLDHFFPRQATQDAKRRITPMFVARSENDEEVVLGYYTLSALSIDLAVLPPGFVKNLPKRAIPAALIGRLAVSLGKVLLADAIQRTLAVSEEIAL